MFQSLEITAGNAIIKQEASTKLLGVQIEKNQQLKKQMTGTGGVVSALSRGFS